MSLKPFLPIILLIIAICAAFIGTIVYVRSKVIAPKKTKKLKGVYKNADEGMKELIAKIDEEELNKQKIISITCEEKLARYLLEKLSELLREKVKEDIL